MLRRIAAVAVFVVVGALLVSAFLASRREQDAERERELAIVSPQRVARGQAGEIVVSLDRTSQARIGLQVAPLASATLRPELVATGTLQEDPSRSFMLRAPIAGTLRVTGSVEWPRLGISLSDGAVIGAIEPRVAPTTKVDLQSRLAAARGDVAAAAAAVRAARAAFDRNTELHAHGIVADRVLEDSAARVKEHEARLAAANEQVRLIGESVEAVAGPTGPIPLRLARGGEVLDVRAQPGEAVESGQPIVRVGRFDALLAKVEVPAGERIDPKVATARLVVLGHEDRPLRGSRVALAASDPRTLGQAVLFRVAADGLLLRPGQAVTAYLAAPGPRRAGVVVPRSAIVRFDGKAWAYVALGPERFARRDVALDHATAEGWVVTTGLSPGDRVVTTGAETLLSEERKSDIRSSD